MTVRSLILGAVITTAVLAFAQKAPLVSSHAPAAKPAAAASHSAGSGKVASMAAKPVARVNGATLTEIDLVREMYAIFPYAQQHNGFPKDLEPEIRRGALDMIVFEELVYQDAKRRNITVAPEKITRAEASFKKQFADANAYKQYLGVEMKGDKAILREKIRRSLLIEQVLKAEVNEKSVVTLAEAKAFYDKNPKDFERAETVSIQTISIIPPESASAAVREEAKLKIKDIARLGKEAKTSRDFGIIAEQVSEDDWRTKLGDRGTVPVLNLPPEITKAARAMKVGEVSAPIAVDRAWVVIRLNAHTPAGKVSFTDAKAKLLANLRKQKQQSIRAALNQKLRKDAKVELL